MNENLSRLKKAGKAIYAGILNFFGLLVFLSFIKDKIGGAK